MKQHPAIKVMPTSGSKAEWDANILKARQLGAVSRDNDYAYNPERTAIVIRNNYISRTDATKKSVGSSAGGEIPTKISTAEFQALSSLHDVYNIGKACVAEVKAAVAEMPCAQTTLKVNDCDVLVQNDVVWATVGLPKLKSLGVEITTLNGKDYILDVANNTATEFTSETASALAKDDLISGKVTPFTQWAKSCDLIENMVLTKTID